MSDSGATLRPMASAARRSESRSQVGAREGASHSGRLLLRMPSELHAELAHEAEREGMSLNQLIVGVLSGDVSRYAPPPPAPPPARNNSRLLRVALLANLVVVAVAGTLAIGLLVAAWRAGF